MKRTVKKATLASVFALALAATAVGAANVNVAFATGAVETSDKIAMVDGAALRLESEEPEVGFGLRFKTQVNKAWYDELVEAGKTPQVYTVLLPTDMLTAELTEATAEIVTADIDEAKGYELGENYVFCTVLTSIPETAYGTEISARSYIVVDDQTTLYSPLFEETNASVARSVVAVADKALTEDAQAYAAVEKYLIKGVDVPDNRYLALDGESNVSAKLLFENGTSEAVQTLLNEKYEFTYSSNAEETVTVAEDGTLTAKAVGSAQITVKNETLNVEKTITVNVYEKTTPVYGVMSFDNLDMVDDVTAFGSTQDLKLVNDNGETKISFAMEPTTEYGGFVVAAPAWVRNFDTMSITAEITEENNGTLSNATWLFWGMSTAQLSKVEEYTFNFDPNDETVLGKWANVTNEDVDTSEFRITIKRRQANSGQSATFLVSAPKFGINDIAYASGDAVINLYEKFHTEAGKASFTFTPTGGTASQIDNPEAYAGTADGVITATISMDGYAAGTVTANYDYTALSVYGQVLDFTDRTAMEASVSAYADASGAVSDVGVVENGTGKYAIAFTATNSAKNKTYGVNITKPEWVDSAKNAYLKVTFELYSNTGKAKYCPYSTNFLGGEHTSVSIGGAVLTEGGTVAEMTTQVSLANIVKGDVIRIFITSNNATASVSKFKITEISVGYKDMLISANHENSLNLATHFGVQESEISDVTFNGATVSNVTAFAPTESGTLSFTLKRAGYMSEECNVNVIEATETLTYSGTAINLEGTAGEFMYMYYSHFSATYQAASASSPTEVTNQSGERNFAPTENGVLAITVAETHPKYATTTFKIDVTVETA